MVFELLLFGCRISLFILVPASQLVFFSSGALDDSCHLGAQYCREPPIDRIRMVIVTLSSFYCVRCSTVLPRSSSLFVKASLNASISQSQRKMRPF